MRINQRGWRVLCSVASDDGLHCVDLYTDTRGYGFAVFRGDPEDLGVWILMVGQGSGGFAEPQEAGRAAAARVAWLAHYPVAAAQLATWIDEDAATRDW